MADRVTQGVLEAQVQAAALARVTQEVLEAQVQAAALARSTQIVILVQVPNVPTALRRRRVCEEWFTV